jgi:hypothetical protein
MPTDSRKSTAFKPDDELSPARALVDAHVSSAVQSILSKFLRSKPRSTNDERSWKADSELRKDIRSIVERRFDVSCSGVDYDKLTEILASTRRSLISRLPNSAWRGRPRFFREVRQHLSLLFHDTEEFAAQVRKSFAETFGHSDGYVQTKSHVAEPGTGISELLTVTFTTVVDLLPERCSTSGEFEKVRRVAAVDLISQLVCDASLSRFIGYAISSVLAFLAIYIASRRRSSQERDEAPGTGAVEVRPVQDTVANLTAEEGADFEKVAGLTLARELRIPSDVASKIVSDTVKNSGTADMIRRLRKLIGRIASSAAVLLLASVFGHVAEKSSRRRRSLREDHDSELFEGAESPYN